VGPEAADVRPPRDVLSVARVIVAFWPECLW